ncbi:histone-lysine N-methyltransferase SMYD3-like isoform X2 [Homarus americanus]|uniref:histone-lysine N-methyltransferase SMYD3-like isoform X2 n=1 Tax=Homarus americanus TaxID=6706 RepID=UPI001C46DDBE|nr:histone-lysine N-methyltransferase SMYD3-like isoform X2 [Homarus americanus]
MPRYKYLAKEVLEQQKVAKGNVLLTSKPFVYLVNGSLKGLYCDYCLKKKRICTLQRCSGCKAECYCDRDCQRGAWDIHRYECKNLQRIHPLIPPDTAKLMAKVIFKLKNGGDQIEEKLSERKSRKFKDLMNHYTDLKDDKNRQEHLTSLIVVLRKYIGSNNLPNEVDLQGIFGRICVNSFSITDQDMNTAGTGVYLAASVFDHSCQPNSYVTFDGKRLMCRALVDMPSLDWSKLRISYIDVMNTTMDRRNELHRRYYFWCDCRACHNPERDKLMSSINCGNPKCTAPVHIDEDDDMDAPVGPCTVCGFNELSSDTRKKYCSIAKYCREQMEVMKDSYYLDLSQRGLEMQGDLFYKLNLLRVKFLDAAFEAAICVENWDTAIKYGMQNIEGVKFCYGEDHPNIGLMLLKLGKICLHVYRTQEALQYLKQAEPVLRVSHGTSHPTYKEELMALLQQAHEELMFMSQKKKKRINDISVVP